MTARPARGALACLVTAVLMHLLARVTGDAWLALASGAALGALVASVLLRPPLRSLVVSVQGPDRVVAGKEVEQVLVVRNGGSRRTPPARWEETGSGLEPVARDLPGLGPGEQVRLPLTRLALRRGEYAGSAVVVTSAPFGVVRWQRQLDGRRQLVHPVTGGGRLSPLYGGAQQEALPAAVSGPGLEVLGLRPWRPGDSARAVSARASARHGRPLVLERERDTGAALLVAVARSGSGDAWEAQVSRAATLAVHAVREGRAVALVAGDGGPPAERATEARDVLDFLARVDGSGPIAGDALRRGPLPLQRGATVLLVVGRGDGSDVDLPPGCEVEVLRAG